MARAARPCLFELKSRAGRPCHFRVSDFQLMSTQLDILALEPFYGGARRACWRRSSVAAATLDCAQAPAARMERRLRRRQLVFRAADPALGRPSRLLFTSETMNLADLYRLVPADQHTAFGGLLPRKSTSDTAGSASEGRPHSRGNRISAHAGAMNAGGFPRSEANSMVLPNRDVDLELVNPTPQPPPRKSGLTPLFISARF